MILLGSERRVTQDYSIHKTAEDYAGKHLSIIKIQGRARVLKVVKKYIAHEDTINFDDYINNQSKWKDGTYYNCVSITGKKVRYHQSELGGNQVELEFYEEGKKRRMRLLHMADVLVDMGDIVDSNTVIGKQGNTGLVLSKKSINDVTYGSHVHCEVFDENYKKTNPRNYALSLIKIDYQEQTNIVDNSKKQIKIIVDKINIREKPSTSSNDIGDVYNGEVYDVLGIIQDSYYTWYHIKTSLGLTGYVANERNKNWIEVLNEDENIEEEVKEVDQLHELKLIYTCPKDGMYAVKLKAGERLYIE